MPSTVSSSRLGLAGLCILLAGQLLPMIDFSIVNVALDASPIPSAPAKPNWN